MRPFFLVSEKNISYVVLGGSNILHVEHPGAKLMISANEISRNDCSAGKSPRYQQKVCPPVENESRGCRTRFCDRVFTCIFKGYFSDGLYTFSENRFPRRTLKLYCTKGEFRCTRESATGLTFLTIIPKILSKNMNLLIISAADDFRGVPFFHQTIPEPIFPNVRVSGG